MTRGSGSGYNIRLANTCRGVCLLDAGRAYRVHGVGLRREALREGQRGAADLRYDGLLKELYDLRVPPLHGEVQRRPVILRREGGRAEV